MAAVHREVSLSGDFADPRTLRHSDVVSIADRTSRLVVHACLQVLNQGPAAPDVPGLKAIADSEERLVQVGGVLHQELVDGLPPWVGGATFRDALLAILFG